MKKGIGRLAAFLLAVILCATMVRLPAQAANPASVQQQNTYVNTGNQRQDIVGVALTQVGYQEKGTNDTYYGDWFGLTGYEWCGIFVSWCARQAEIPESVLRQNGIADPRNFGIPYYHGSEYTPKTGDIFFNSSFGHTGIVWYVDGEYVYTIEGNTNTDGSWNGYIVAIRKRLIRNCYFGVPNYTSDDAHEYERHVELTHPHKAYYQCIHCDAKYYTSYTDYLAGCQDCLSCGCDDDYAGWYKVVGDWEYHKIRWSHTGSQSNYAVALGSVVYVYGADPSKDTAYIEFYGRRGHIPLSCLQAYPDAPEAPNFTMTQSNWLPGEKAQLQWDAPEGAELYRLQLYKEGILYEEKELTDTQYQPLLPEGSYEVRITAANRAGQSAVSTAYFTIRLVCHITLDLQNGHDPQTQLHTPGEDFTLPASDWDGHTLLGWTDQAGSNIALYAPETVLQPSQDSTFYAIWTAENAQPEALTIQTPFTTTLYTVGEAFSDEGLTLDCLYPDGAGVRITSGFTVEGFDPDTPGEQTLTISYGGVSVTCQVTVIDYILGDIDGNKLVNRDDVMALLWHINFPNLFPLESTPNEGA